MARMTDVEIRNAKHTGTGAFTTLSVGDGLELRIRPTGGKTWVVRYQISGKRKTPSIGVYPEMRLAQAVAIAQDYKKLVKSGIDPLEQATKEAEAVDAQRQADDAEQQARLEKLKAETNAIQRQEEDVRLAKLVAEEAERLAREGIRTVSRAAQDWLALEIQSCRKDGGSEMRRMLAKDVLPFIGEKELRAVSKSDVLDILDRVKLRGSRSQSNHTFSDLRQFFNWCLRRELIDKSPMMLLSKEKDAGGKVTERERILTKDEILLLRDQLPAAKMERQNELALWIQLSTIVRVGELLQARWQDVDISAGTWRIHDTKNGKEHTVFLSEYAQRHFEELRSLTGWSAWCYPTSRTTDNHVCTKTITRQVNDRQRDEPMQGRSKATNTLLLPGGKWTPHDLRRTGASIMRSLKISKDVIELCLNHTDDNKMARIYQRYDLIDERREAWRVLGAHLDSLLHGEAGTNVIHASFGKVA